MKHRPVTEPKAAEGASSAGRKCLYAAVQNSTVSSCSKKQMHRQSSDFFGLVMHGRLSASELNMRARRQFTDSKSSKPTQQSTFTGSVDVSGYVNE